MREILLLILSAFLSGGGIYLVGASLNYYQSGQWISPRDVWKILRNRMER